MTPAIGAIVVGLVVALFFVVLVLIVLARRSRRLEARLVGLTRDSDGQSLEAVLEAHLDKVVEVARKVDDIGGRTKVLESRQPRAFQRTGLVRYNPFDETGGNQSFALALLDADGDGWVLSQPPRPLGHARVRQGHRRGPVGHRPVRGGVRGDQAGDGLTG